MKYHAYSSARLGTYHIIPYRTVDLSNLSSKTKKSKASLSPEREKLFLRAAGSRGREEAEELGNNDADNTFLLDPCFRGLQKSSLTYTLHVGNSLGTYYICTCTVYTLHKNAICTGPVYTT